MKTRLALICTVLAACDGDVQTFVNEGRVCADADEMAAFEPGSSLSVVVTMSSCISACPRFAEASCEAEVSAPRCERRCDCR